MSLIQEKIKKALETQSEIFGEIIYQKLPNRAEKQQNSNTPPLEAAEKIEVEVTSGLFASDFQKTETLDELNSKINSCLKCPLGGGRQNFVFGVGNPTADVMLIGEAPGAEEDRLGEPFVGRAGKLLNDILKAINFRREDVYIANIVKCRPPKNRNPLPVEMEACLPYLYKQIDLINPMLILALGKVAATGLLKVNSSLTMLRGKIFEFNGIKTMVTYHPAALLRNPNWKKFVWEDVQKFRDLYNKLLREK